MRRAFRDSPEKAWKCLLRESGRAWLCRRSTSRLRNSRIEENLARDPGRICLDFQEHVALSGRGLTDSACSAGDLLVDLLARGAAADIRAAPHFHYQHAPAVGGGEARDVSVLCRRMLAEPGAIADADGVLAGLDLQ